MKLEEEEEEEEEASTNNKFPFVIRERDRN